MKPKLVVIEGTNASGKSGLGVALAAHYGGEVVSADSRQVFRGLDLGSGKITPEEMQGVRHHLIDIAEPNEFFSMHDFQRLAYEAVDDVRARGRTPFLVGGTGLYVASVTDGYVMSDTEPDLEYRAYLETMDTPKLYEMLRELRPEMEIDEKNRNRVMRQLEKIHDGDDHSAPNAPRYDCLKLGVTWPRPVLRAHRRAPRPPAGAGNDRGGAGAAGSRCERRISQKARAGISVHHPVSHRRNSRSKRDGRAAAHRHQAVRQAADHMVPAG